MIHIIKLMFLTWTLLDTPMNFDRGEEDPYKGDSVEAVEAFFLVAAQ